MMKKITEIKYQKRKKFMAGGMVFSINIFEEILDREVSLHSYKVFLISKTLTSETKKTQIEAKRSRMRKASNEKNNQSMKKEQKDKAQIKFQKGWRSMFMCQLMYI